MSRNVIDYLFEQWAYFYYSAPFAIFCQLIAIVIGTIFHRRQKEISFLLVYIYSSLIYFTAMEYFTAFDISIGSKNKINVVIIEVSNTIFTIIEYVSFYYLFFKIYNDWRTRIILVIFSILFFVSFAWFIIIVFKGADPKDIVYWSYSISGIEMALITFGCFPYFYCLMHLKRAINFLETPEFWIITGLFFYSVIVIPFFLLEQYLFQKTHRYFVTIHYIFFGLLFLFLGRAFLCKKNLAEKSIIDY